MSPSAGSVGRSVSNDRLLEGLLRVRLLTTLPLSLEQYCEIVRQINTAEACEKLIYKFSVRYTALSSQGTYSGTEFFHAPTPYIRISVPHLFRKALPRA